MTDFTVTNTHVRYAKITGDVFFMVALHFSPEDGPN